MKIFIIDDEEFSRNSLQDFLTRKFPNTTTIETFETGEAALKKMTSQPEVVILDYYLDLNDAQAANGMEVLKRIKEISPATYVLLLSSQESMTIAYDTMKYGAYDYVVKGDSAFHRLQIIIERINGYGRATKTARSGRPVNAVLLVMVVILVAWIIISRLR